MVLELQNIWHLKSPMAQPSVSTHNKHISSRVSWEVSRGHTGAVKLHNSFGNSHCTELTASTFGCGVLWQPLNLEGNYKQLTAQLNPLQEFKQSPPEFLSWCGGAISAHTALGSEQQPSHCECRSAGACQEPNPHVWPELSWPQHSATWLLYPGTAWNN